MIEIRSLALGGDQVPFAFTGKTDKLTFTVEPPIKPEDEKLAEAYRIAAGINQ